MAFAILKLSYSQSGETPVVGSICGSGFFIDPWTQRGRNAFLRMAAGHGREDAHLRRFH